MLLLGRLLEAVEVTRLRHLCDAHVGIAVAYEVHVLAADVFLVGMTSVATVRRLIALLEVNDHLLRYVITQHEDLVARAHVGARLRIREHIRVLVVTGASLTIQTNGNHVLLEQMLKQLVVRLVPALFGHADLPKVGLRELATIVLLQLLFEVLVDLVAASDQDLLQNGHDVAVVESLRRQRVDDGRDVDLARSEQRTELELDVFTASARLQEVNV